MSTDTTKTNDIKPELIIRAAAMLHARRDYWAEQQQKNCMEATGKSTSMPGYAADYTTWATYSSACDILDAAIQGRDDLLDQFDYYEHHTGEEPRDDDDDDTDDEPSSKPAVRPADVDGCHCIFDVCIKNYADPTPYCKGCECNEAVDD